MASTDNQIALVKFAADVQSLFQSRNTIIEAAKVIASNALHMENKIAEYEMMLAEGAIPEEFAQIIADLLVTPTFADLIADVKVARDAAVVLRDAHQHANA